MDKVYIFAVATSGSTESPPHAEPDARAPVWHPMAVVARRTGLHPDVIRAWERRYGVVRPRRSAGNRRLYLESDVRRLELVVRTLRLGWSIGQVAARSDAELAQLVGAEPDPGAVAAPPDRGTVSATRDAGAEGDRAAACVERALGAVASLDPERLRAELDGALVELGRVALLDRVVAPLLDRVGGAYARGELRIAHEHVASSVVAQALDGLHAAVAPSASAPSIVVTTPAFQHHELGARLAAASARIEGWRTTWLGPNLPAEEIAAAARARGARAIALGLTFPPADPGTDAELRRLGALVGGRAAIVAGGAAAASYAAALEAIGAELLDDLQAFRAWLARAR